MKNLGVMMDVLKDTAEFEALHKYFQLLHEIQHITSHIFLLKNLFL